MLREAQSDTRRETQAKGRNVPSLALRASAHEMGHLAARELYYASAVCEARRLTATAERPGQP